MYLCSLLLYAVAFAGQVTAFYPYKQSKSPQEDRGFGSPSKRGERVSEYAQPEEAILKKPLSVALKRKGHPSNFESYHRSIGGTAVIARREHGCPKHQDVSPVKRDNTFNVVTAAEPSQTNSAPIHEDGTDFSYFAPLPFGSEGTLMYMLVDTGAANTWVMGSDCTSEACRKHNTFGEADSATFKSTGKTFNLTYGTGSVSGATVNDTVQIAGMSIPLAFGAAKTTSDDFLDYPMDGILGLGRSASNTMQFPTAMQAMMSTEELPANIFGVNLQRDSDGSMDGELNFGAPDTSKYTGDLSYTDTVPDGKMWEIPIDDAGFNGNLCKFTGKSAVIDTGTTFMLLPPDDAKQLHAQIPQSQQDGEVFKIPCSTKQPVQVVISGVSYNITPADYIGKPVEGGDFCESNIISRQAFTSDEWLLGDVFLKNVYTVFDFDKDRIGFGVKDETSSSTQSTSTSATSNPTTVGSTTGIASTNPASLTASLPEGARSSPSTTASRTSSIISGSEPSSSKISTAAAASPSQILTLSIVIISLHLLRLA